MSAKIATPLSRKAVLVSVNISQWSARKLDRKVTDRVNREHGAAKDAGRYNKLLIAAEHLSEMQSLVSQARSLHYSMTRPWADEGPRILPNALFNKFSDQFRTLKRDFNDAADRFAAAYPSFVEDRRQALNGLFDPADYPSADEIRGKFKLDLTVLPLPDAEDFRSELDADTVAEIKRELAETSAKVIDAAMQHTVTQIIETVGHMAEKLKAYKVGADGRNVFRDSLVGNVRDLAELLPAFNLTNDPRLTALTSRIQTELCTEDPDSLRKNDQARASVAKSADDIVAEVSALLG
jgi:hypothetical protein